MHKCKFCGKEFDNGLKLGGHIVWCKSNPNRESSITKISFKSKGRTLSNTAKNKISKTVREKIKKGQWHNSFSKSRTHEYRGEKFHGTWELRYAKYLDENNIKWRRPKEKFQYIFENKNRYYTPDFYLTEENIYIEIKGYETDKDVAKWKNFPLGLKILNGEDLHKLGILDKHEFRKIK